MNPDVLNSWKEIAGYLGRGVRTAQRWEAELHLPVRRPHLRKRTSVVALRSDLDQWLHNADRPALGHGALVSPSDGAQTRDILRANRREMRTLITRLREQAERTRGLVEHAHDIAARCNAKQ